MLDTVDSRRFDEWVAYKRLEPDKLDRLLEILLRGLTFLCNAWSDGKVEFKDLDPWYKDPEPEFVSPDEAARRMKGSTWGGG